MALTFETPPTKDDPSTPTRDDVAAALTARTGEWAVVGRVDRAARAEAMAERITSGREYGPGFTALVRRVGNEHRVYARKLA